MNVSDVSVMVDVGGLSVAVYLSSPTVPCSVDLAANLRSLRGRLGAMSMVIGRRRMQFVIEAPSVDCMSITFRPTHVVVSC